MSMSIEDAGVVRAPKPVPNTPESVFAQLRMDGKVVAITGGADGIGFAVAEAVAEAGANVALWYNSNAVAIERSKDLEKRFGIKSKAYRVEVSDHTVVEQTMSQVVADFGKLDVFVANAGMAISKAITEQTVEEYRKQMSVNRQFWPDLSLAVLYFADVLQSMESSTAPNMPVRSSRAKGSVISSLRLRYQLISSTFP